MIQAKAGLARLSRRASEERPVLELVRSPLKPGGAFVLVEYDADQGRVPSRFLGSIHAAERRVSL